MHLTQMILERLLMITLLGWEVWIKNCEHKFPTDYITFVEHGSKLPPDYYLENCEGTMNRGVYIPNTSLPSFPLNMLEKITELICSNAKDGTIRNAVASISLFTPSNGDPDSDYDRCANGSNTLLSQRILERLLMITLLGWDVWITDYEKKFPTEHIEFVKHGSKSLPDIYSDGRKDTMYKNIYTPNTSLPSFSLNMLEYATELICSRARSLNINDAVASIGINRPACIPGFFFD